MEHTSGRKLGDFMKPTCPLAGGTFSGASGVSVDAPGGADWIAAAGVATVVLAAVGPATAGSLPSPHADTSASATSPTLTTRVLTRFPRILDRLLASARVQLGPRLRPVHRLAHRPVGRCAL